MTRKERAEQRERDRVHPKGSQPTVKRDANNQRFLKGTAPPAKTRRGVKNRIPWSVKETVRQVLEQHGEDVKAGILLGIRATDHKKRFPYIKLCVEQAVGTPGPKQPEGHRGGLAIILTQPIGPPGIGFDPLEHKSTMSLEAKSRALEGEVVRLEAEGEQMMADLQLKAAAAEAGQPLPGSGDDDLEEVV